MTIIIAVVAAVIVVSAGGIVFFATQNNTPTAEHGASHLQIRGNVNDDMTIDAEDMTLLEKVKSGESTLEDYPLADVNGDGNVDDTDKTLLQDLIDRKEGCSVYVICLNSSGVTTFQEVKYPLRNVVTYGTNVQMPTLYANGGQYVAGYFTSNYKTAEGSINPDATDLKSTTRQITPTSWVNFTALEASLESKGGMGAFIVDYSGIAALTEAYEKDVKDAKIPLLIFSSADAASEITTVLTLGFLFGGDCEKMGHDYAVKSWNVINAIADKNAGLSDSDKKTYIGCTMYIYICQNNSTFASSGTIAGGMPYYKTNSTFAADYDGSNSVKMSSVEALSNYKDIGCILNSRSMDWGLDPTEYKNEIIATWTHDNAGTPSTEFFKGFENKLAYIDNLLPGAVKVAYMAHALYGDRFSLDYANNILLEFIQLETLPLKGQTLDTVIPYIDNSIYKKATDSATINVGDDSVNMLYSLYKNYNGVYKTGAADATYAFAPGSKTVNATLSVANGNTDPELNENTFNLRISSEAKTVYTQNYAEYATLTSATKPFTAATLTSEFYGVYACYLNDSGKGTAHVTGYVSDVVFDCYLYESYDITNADLQTLVTAMFAAVTNPVTYDGPAIPDGESTGAKRVAETLAFNNSAKWSVSTAVDATENSATAVFASKSAMSGSDANYNVAISSVYNKDDFTTKSATVNGYVGSTVVSSKTPGVYYQAYTGTVDGVSLTAAYGHIDGKSYSYLCFVMQKGNILIDCSELSNKVCIYNTTESSLAADTQAFLEELATAANTGTFKGSELVVKALAANYPARWTASETEPTIAESVIVMKTKKAMGGADTTQNLTFVSNSGVDAAYTAAAATMDSHDTELVSNKTAGVYYSTYTGTVSGVTFVGKYGHIDGKSYSYLYFVMKAGDRLIDCSQDKVCIYNTTESDLATDTQAFLDGIAAAMLL